MNLILPQDLSAAKDRTHQKLSARKPTSDGMPLKLFFSDTCAVIVSYFPDETLIRAVEVLLQQVGSVVIVDNNSTGQSRRILTEVASTPNVTIIYNEFNLGMASALNQGVKWILDRSFDWILTFDQDTVMEPAMVGKMRRAYEESPDGDRIGILAPIHFDRMTGYQSRYLRNLNEPYSNRDIVMTSGNLVPRKTFEKVGFFDDDLFIEYVDHDFCLRVKKFGLKIFLVTDAKMAHSLGHVRKHSIFGIYSFFSHNYAPVRRYYRARNRMVLYRRHFGFKWILRDIDFFTKDFLKILLVEEDRWAKVKATLSGLIDGVLSRMGACEGATYRTPKASKYFVEFREEILPMIPEFSAKALDLGCGSGETSSHLKGIGKFGWVCGIEGSPEAAQAARQNLDQVLEGDIEEMKFPFPDGTFDTILALDILEHLVDPWTVVAELTRLLKPGGVLIASIPNARHYSVLFPLLFLGDWKYSQEGLLDSTHIRFFTKKTAVQLMKSTGLQIEMMDFTGAKRGLGRFVDLMTFGFLTNFFVFQNLIKAKKVSDRN